MKQKWCMLIVGVVQGTPVCLGGQLLLQQHSTGGLRRRRCQPPAQRHDVRLESDFLATLPV